MQLFYSRNSPYARIARVAAIECRLADRIEHVLVVNRDPDSPLLAFNPVGRVPTLVDGDLVIAESMDVCRYLDHVAGTTFARRPTDWRRVSFDGMVIGFLDGIAFWVRELRRASARSEELIGVERRRAERCLRYFDDHVAAHGDPWTYGAAALACSLELMTVADLRPGWRRDFGGLGLWLQDRAARPSMVATRPGP